MKILLDTNVAIWSVCNTEKIPKTIIEKISDENNEIFVSTASIWEITIKSISKPDKIPINEIDFIDYCRQISFDFLPIKMSHITNLRNLKTKSKEFVHKDPFDNIIVSQSVAEGMTLFTSDDLLSKYNYDKIVVV